MTVRLNIEVDPAGNGQYKVTVWDADTPFEMPLFVRTSDDPHTAVYDLMSEVVLAEEPEPAPKPTYMVYVCPECTSADHLNSIQRLHGLAPFDVLWDGTVDWWGQTDVKWESAQSVGVRCENCGWSHTWDHPVSQEALVSVLERIAK